MNIDPRIIGFIKKHHVLTLATSTNNQPYCASCFYVYDEIKNLFIFTSDYSTKHIKDIENQKKVAGAIALETTMIGKIRGIQFTGSITELKDSLFDEAKKAYIKRFPIARLATLNLWAVSPDFIKFTDNRLGFGKKLIWNLNKD